LIEMQTLDPPSSATFVSGRILPTLYMLFLLGSACRPGSHGSSDARPPQASGIDASAPAAIPPAATPRSSMSEAEFERFVVADFTRPWSTRRGVEASDQGHNAIAVRAAPEKVTAAFTRLGAVAVPDALGREVTLGRAIGFVVRLQGHAWTLYLPGDGAPPPPAREISKDLDAPVLEVVTWEEDIEYSYFEHGAIVEHLEGNGEGVTKFDSHTRSRDDLGTRRPAEIADAFAKAHDAYVGDLSAAYFIGDGHTVPFLKAGDKLRVSNPGFTLVLGRGREVVSRPDLEKLDFLVLIR
jgi:hypothetical protein